MTEKRYVFNANARLASLINVAMSQFMDRDISISQTHL